MFLKKITKRRLAIFLRYYGAGGDYDRHGTQVEHLWLSIAQYGRIETLIGNLTIVMGGRAGGDFKERVLTEFDRTAKDPDVRAQLESIVKERLRSEGQDGASE